MSMNRFLTSVTAVLALSSQAFAQGESDRYQYSCSDSTTRAHALNFGVHSPSFIELTKPLVLADGQEIAVGLYEATVSDFDGVRAVNMTTSDSVEVSDFQGTSLAVYFGNASPHGPDFVAKLKFLGWNYNPVTHTNVSQVLESFELICFKKPR